MRRPLAALVVVLGSAGCLPSRDNPRDPANAPVASLRIVDQSGEILGAVSRGRELQLDATASTDPQDRFWCEFTRVTDDGEIPLPCSTCLCPLGDLRREIPVGVEHVFRVAVRDSSGGADYAERTLLLSNSRPVVDAGPTRTLPIGGFPWAPGQPFAVPFAATATDADGDPLLYHWTFSDGAATSADRNDPSFTRPLVSTSATLFVASVTVEEDVPLPAGDDHFTSYPSTTRAVVGFPNLWSAPNGNGAIERLDTGTGFLVPNGADPGERIAAAVFDPVAANEERKAIYVFDNDPAGGVAVRNNRMISAPESDFTSEADAINPGSGSVALASDSARALVWLHVESHNLGGLCPASGEVLASFDARTLAPQSCYELPGSQNRQIEVDALGRVFTWSEFGSALTFLDEAAVAPAPVDLRAGVPSGFFDLIVGGGSRPRVSESDPQELWLVVIPGFFGGTVGLARLEVYRDEDGAGGSAPALRGVADLGVGLATDLAFLTPAELWLEVPETGMHRLDAGVVESYLHDLDDPATPPLLADGGAVIETIPEVLDVIDMIVDPVSGAAWAEGHATGGIHRVSRGGDARLFPVEDAPGVPLVVDPTGRLVFTTRGKLHRGYSASTDGVVHAIGLFNGGFPEADLETGGVWTALLLPPAIARVAEDGTFLRYETSVDIGNQLVPPGLVRLFRLAPGRDTAWVMRTQLPDFGPGILYRADLSRSPPSVTVVLTTAQSLEIVTAGSVWEPSAPLGGDPFVWTARNGQVLALDTNGNPAPANTPFTLPVAEQSAPVFAAMSPGTNALCIATVAGTNLVLRRLAPDGTATLLDTSGLSFPAGSEITSIAALPTPAGDVCFVGYNLNTNVPRVAAWRVPGPGAEMLWLPPGAAAPPERDMDGYAITSIAPQAADSVWVTVLPPGSMAPEKVHLARTGNQLTEDRFLEASSQNVFVYPGSRTIPYEPPVD